MIRSSSPTAVQKLHHCAEAQEEGAQIIANMKTPRLMQNLSALSLRLRRRSKLSVSPPWCSCVRKVGTLATDLALRIVGESLTDDQRSANVVDRFITDLESQSSATRVCSIRSTASAGVSERNRSASSRACFAVCVALATCWAGFAAR